MDVFLLWHANEVPDRDSDAKLIGVYATADDAASAKLRAVKQAGFRDLPDGFQVCPLARPPEDLRE